MGECEVEFEVKYDQTRWGECVAVVGNDAAIGKWNASQGGVVLEAKAFPLWCRRVKVSVPTRLEYKYVVCDEKGVVKWEHFAHGGNRVLTIGEAERRVVVKDGSFGRDGGRVVREADGGGGGGRSAKARRAQSERVDMGAGAAEMGFASARRAMSVGEGGGGAESESGSTRTEWGRGGGASKGRRRLIARLDALQTEVEALRRAVRCARGGAGAGEKSEKEEEEEEEEEEEGADVVEGGGRAEVRAARRVRSGCERVQRMRRRLRAQHARTASASASASGSAWRRRRSGGAMHALAPALALALAALLLSYVYGVRA